MGGVWGDMLAHFSELMMERDILRYNPKVGAGFSPAVVIFKDHEGYVSRNKGGKESVTSELSTENQMATYYCEDRVPRGEIRQGLCVYDDGELFRFVLDNNFAREGGYAKHTLQLVTGNNESQEAAPVVNDGTDEYA